MVSIKSKLSIFLILSSCLGMGYVNSASTNTAGHSLNQIIIPRLFTGLGDNLKEIKPDLVTTLISGDVSFAFDVEYQNKYSESTSARFNVTCRPDFRDLVGRVLASEEKISEKRSGGKNIFKVSFVENGDDLLILKINNTLEELHLLKSDIEWLNNFCSEFKSIRSADLAARSTAWNTLTEKAKGINRKISNLIFADFILLDISPEEYSDFIKIIADYKNNLNGAIRGDIMANYFAPENFDILKDTLFFSAIKINFDREKFEFNNSMGKIGIKPRSKPNLLVNFERKFLEDMKVGESYNEGYDLKLTKIGEYEFKLEENQKK